MSGTLRLAPSPTGTLHVGNALSMALTAARAHRQGAACLVRIEDLDGPRVVAGAATSILNDIARLGLATTASAPADDGSVIDGVMWQSRRTQAYEAALARLSQGALYACRCSRKDLQRAASAPHVGDEGPPYPGTCRALGLPLDAPETALRVDVSRLVQRYGAPPVTDLLCGPIIHDVVADVGDFIVRRKDGLFAYQLAVVVDDGAQGVTEVTRGRDLLSSAPRQALLHHALGQAAPAFAHLPLVVDETGARLSKRSPSAPGLLSPWLDAVGTEGVLGHFLWLLGRGPAGGRATFHAFAAAIDDDALRVEAIVWRGPA